MHVPSWFPGLGRKPTVAQITQAHIDTADPSDLAESEAPAKAEESKMSIFATVIAGLSKAESFIVNVFTKTSEVEKQLVALAPATKAALLATFYDTVKTVQAASSTVAAAASANAPLTITLSVQTAALVKQIIEDAKTDGSVIKSDLVALGSLEAGK